MTALDYKEGERDQSYLGDGVYASWDGFQIWLRVDRDGKEHEVALEGDTLNALVQYAKGLGFKWRNKS